MVLQKTQSKLLPLTKLRPIEFLSLRLKKDTLHTSNQKVSKRKALSQLLHKGLQFLYVSDDAAHSAEGKTQGTTEIPFIYQSTVLVCNIPI